MASESTQRMYAALLARGMAETVAYVPDGGAARTITAIVDRNPPGQHGNAPAPKFAVRLMNHATLGVTAESLNCGRDILRIAERFAGPVKDRQSLRIVGNDAEEIVLEID